jgi:hypothetical protein
MKRFFFCLAVTVILGGCSLSKEYFKSGNYNAAISEATYHLRNNPKKEKEIQVLEKAFRAANQRDVDKITSLKQQGNPSNWGTIYELYENIRRRQELVKPLLPLFLRKEFRNADIALIDIDKELADAKFKASEFLYNSAVQLLNSNNKKNIREAYTKFDELIKLNGSYKDSNLKLQEALQKGKSNVLTKVSIVAKVIVPAEFEEELSRINSADLNDTWLAFTTDKNVQSDFTIENRVTKIDVTPERVSDNTYREQLTIQDGWIYQLDKNGNVMKDTAGNDVKKPKMVMVEAKVSESKQNKACLVAGDYLIFDANKQLVKTIPYSETVVFENYFASFLGDKRALSTISLKKIGGGFIPFPPDMKMMMDAAQLVRNRMVFNIQNNKAMFLN